MNIGYSYWGFLADIKMNKDFQQLSTPDGNAFYSWSIIKQLHTLGHTVTTVMPDRDKYAVKALGVNAFRSWATKDRFDAYRAMAHTPYDNINLQTVTEDEMFELFDNQHFDKILLEWRMQIDGRNTLDCRDKSDWQPDLFIQDCIIKYCKSRDIELIIFDLDYKITPDDVEYLGDKVKILELGTKWKDLPNAKKVYIPFDFSHIHEFGIRPLNERKTSLVYIGNRYERDWCIDKYIPTDLENVIVHGNWTEAGRDSESRWPEIKFAPRLQTSCMHDAYSDAVCTILLAKRDYCQYNFMTARIIEALFYGTVPLFIEEYGEETIKEYAGVFSDFLTVRSAEDVKEKVNKISSMPYAYATIMIYLRERLKMMDAIEFVKEIV